MKYMVYDLETQTKTYLKRKASPFHPDNHIVAAGWKIQGDTECSWDYNDTPCKYHLKIPEDVSLLVGFNLKFDMLWQWDNPDLIAFFKRGGKIWDGQYVEYLINGQNRKYHYASLTETAPRYGGTEKIDEVKVLWDAGVETSDINKDLLIDYLVGTVEEGRDGGDIGNTEKVFLGQLKKVIDLGMLKAVQSRMDGLCATTEMEWNGLKIDVEEARKQFKELSAKREAAFEKLQTFVPDTPPELDFKWSSRLHKSCLIFGGTVKYQKKGTYEDPKTGELARLVAYEDWPLVDGVPIHPDEFAKSGLTQDTFKGGKRKGEPKTKKIKVPGELKTKYIDHYFTFEGFAKGRPDWYVKTLDGAGKPYYSTTSEIIALLEYEGVPFCDVLVEYEALNKEINTYFLSHNKQGELTGMLTCIDPVDNRIHHNLNHCSTVTARLSSGDPNLQNIPRGDKSNLKRVFTSRFTNGSMIEADYSQLEVVTQGVLTGDHNLLNDLRNRIDFHCKRVAIQPKYKITYEEVKSIINDEDHPYHNKWKKIRTAAKIFSFQRAYGAGASLIATFTGMTVDEVKELIAADEKAYPGVVQFNEDVAETVRDNSKSFRDPSNDHGVFRRGYWQSPTGCLYHFRSWPAKDWQLDQGITESFSPTEMKNYPVQGTGGEIVQGMCGLLWRHFVSTDNYGGRALLCNTVHDCVWVDSDDTVREQVASDVVRILEQVPEWFAQFDVDCTVPFPVDAEWGPNMLDLKHIT